MDVTRESTLPAGISKVLIDSCVLLQLQDSGAAYEMLLPTLVKRGIVFCITRTILKEFDRLSQETVHNGLAETWKLITHGLLFLDDYRPEIVLESARIPIHSPDNLHIAAAKREGAAIVSLDNLLVKIARNEDVEAYTPDEILTQIVN